MAEKNNTRIDKWLWAVRIYKTRSMATKACATGKVKINSKTVKASRIIQRGELIQVRKGAIKFEHKVLEIADNRMGAKMVRNFMEDITPKDELAKLESAQTHPKQTRKKGQGRPTKRERRIMDQLQGKF